MLAKMRYNIKQFFRTTFRVDKTRKNDKNINIHSLKILFASNFLLNKTMTDYNLF